MMDCQPPETYHEDIRTARKKKRCCECGRMIEPGEQYADCRGVWEGEFSQYPQHLRCYHFARFINLEFFAEAYKADGVCMVPFSGVNEFFSEYPGEFEELRYCWWFIQRGFEFQPGMISADVLREAAYG